MTGWLLLVIIVAAATAIWPVGRWALSGDGKASVMGFWVSVVAAVIAWVDVLVRGEAVGVGPVWAVGALFGVAYSVGFILLIMRCLQIGPVGPTVTVNNMAMVCGVVYGIAWLGSGAASATTIAGVAGACAALVLIGVGRSKEGETGRAASGRWLAYVLMGGALSGLSFIAQTYIGTRQAEHGKLFVAAGFLVSALILAPAMLREGGAIRGRREGIGGLLIGTINAVVLPLTVAAIGRLGAHIVLPVTVASPILLVLVIGRVFYGERLRRPVWIGCIIGSVSILLLAWSSAIS